MASVQSRSGWFHLHFRFGGRQYTHALKTKDRREAEAIRGSVDRVLIRIRNRELPAPPHDVDLMQFLLAGGKLAEEVRPQAVALTLRDLRDRYLSTHGNGALEDKTLKMVQIHFNHLIRHFGEGQVVQQLTTQLLQGYLDKRSKDKGQGREKLSPVTIEKDIASLRAAWNWAVKCGTLTGVCPNRALIYPKMDQKPPFQTREEIERKIRRGGLTTREIADLWECLFLTKPDVAEFLVFAKQESANPHLYPMIAFAAHTGARRSELMRMRIDDVDLEAGSALIRERKRVRGSRSSRRVPVSGFLQSELKDWLAHHPGGQMMFCRKQSKSDPLAMTPMSAYEQFRSLVRGSKWDVLRGWHVLRHSFISICVADGVDARILKSWVGHLSEATHRRYTHLIPNRERQIIQGVFG